MMSEYNFEKGRAAMMATEQRRIGWSQGFDSRKPQPASLLRPEPSPNPKTQASQNDSNGEDESLFAVDETNADDAVNEDNNYDKAEWTNSENNAAFCSLCVEEISAGNRSNGFMTNRAYKNIAAKFQHMRGLRHSKIQLKNRWESLKRYYSFWLWLNKQTGLGRDSNGGIIASDDFWKLHTKGHAEWRKCKHGPPENLPELEIMFEHTAVDGSTACTPGQYVDAAVDGGDEGEEGDGVDDSTICNNAMKKRSTGTPTVTSPKKRIKSPVVKILKGIWESVQETNVVAQKSMVGEYVDDSIKNV